MAKQNINVGTAANDKKGDSLRAAFVKVNANFTELYTALGINADGNLNIGAFEFAGSVMSTTDSSAIVIDQATTITSNLSVGGDLLPQTAHGGDLGSSTLPWRSLYVSNNTIYIGGTAVGVDANGQLTVSGSQVNAPSSTLVNGSNTVSLDANGNITFPQGTLLGYSDPGGFIINGAVDKDIAIYTYNGADAHGWTFGTDGSLTLPGDIRSQGNINIDINLTDSTLRRWRFGEDGDTVFPNNVSINYSGGNVQFPRIIADSGKAFSVQGQGASGSAAMSWTVDPDAAGQYAAVGVSKGGGDNLAKVILQAQSDSGDAATAKLWKFDETGALTIPGDILSEGAINIDINLSDSTLRRWRFGEDGDLTFPDATVQTTAFVQGEQVFTLDTGAIDYAPTVVDFNLLFVTPAIGYSETDPTSVTLPNGVPGQRLVIFNGYNLATLTVNPGPFGRDISGGVVAEFIYSDFDGLWMPLYGTNSPT